MLVLRSGLRPTARLPLTAITSVDPVMWRTAPRRAPGYLDAARPSGPNDARALSSLHGEQGRTMRSLADEWECDASNATWIVDRLERMRLAERRTVPHDRRLKLVVLTAKGARVKAELMEEFHTPPLELLSLDRTDLEALEHALRKLDTPEEAP